MQKLEKEAMENCHDVSWPRCNEVPYQRFLAFAALLISCWRMPAVHIKKEEEDGLKTNSPGGKYHNHRYYV